MAGYPDILSDGVNAMADPSVGLLAETTLYPGFLSNPTSHLRDDRCPKPKSEISAKMSQSFLATTINKLVARQHHHGLRDNDSSAAETISLIARKYDIRGNNTLAASEHLMNVINVFSERSLPHFDLFKSETLFSVQT